MVRFEPQNEIYNFRVVPELEVSKEVVVFKIHLRKDKVAV